MHRILCFAAALLPFGVLRGQTPPATPPESEAEQPAEAPEATLPAPKPYPLLDTGSFEFPKVTQRTPKAQGGNPVSKLGRREWIRFDSSQSAEGIGLTAGLTNEIARTGKQSLYVDFDHVKSPAATVDLASDLISIQPQTRYRFGIWGRVDKTKPLTLDQRLGFIRLEVDFFQRDKETQAGEPVLKIQPVPGSRNRKALFTAEAWSEYFADVPSPADAAYVKITWTAGASAEKGEINGTLYLDDATVKGLPGKTPEEWDEEDAAREAASAATAPPTAATPPPVSAAKSKGGKK